MPKSSRTEEAISRASAPSLLAVGLLQKGKQQMLRTDNVMPQLTGFRIGLLQNLLHTRGHILSRNIGGCPGTDRLGNAADQPFHGDTRISQRLLRNTVLGLGQTHLAAEAGDIAGNMDIILAVLHKNLLSGGICLHYISFSWNCQPTFR